ncbi:MAG TPA: RDD family protein [bacterium]|jgi:uncharacterized RDD family membrane protein YckC|nr:RDD family protein [bacterium]
MATEGTAQAPYASIGDRFLAQLLDLVLAFSVFVFTGLTLAARVGGRTQGGFNLEGWPALFALTLTALPVLAYFILTEWLFGATLGKVVAGIRVQRIGGRKLGLGAAIIRNALRAVDIVPFYIFGALLVMVTDRKQRLGDVAAGSVVVRRETPRAARIAALIAVLLLAAAGFIGGVRFGGPSPSGPRAGVARQAATSGLLCSGGSAYVDGDFCAEVMR